MILVPHYVAASPIAGLGLFTASEVAEGETVYQFDRRLVLIFTDAEVRQMPQAMQQRLAIYSYRGKGSERLLDAMYYGADDSRFMNHSDQPNTRWLAESETYVATQAIAADSELTCDYAEFCERGDLCFNF